MSMSMSMSMCQYRLSVSVGVLFLVLCLIPITFIIDVDASIIVSITSPKRLKQQISNDDDNDLNVTPAVFGSPKYGSYVNGILFYPNVTAHRLACSPIDITKEPDRPTGDDSLIWIVDRSKRDGPASEKCSFVTKVRNAQAAGAIAVVVRSLEDDVLVYMADDGSGGDVSTPAVMIKYSATMEREKGFIANMWKETTSPVPAKQWEFQRIGMQIRWSIPTSEGNVKWDLWTSAYDPESISLKRLFGRSDLELHSNTYFNPRYFYYRGYQMDMENCEVGQNYLDCDDLCVAKGKYCQHDPDGDEDNSLTGADIVIENLWQSCVWEHLNTSSAGDAHMIRNKWWGYVSDFEQKCDTADKWRSPTCRNLIMDTYGIDKSAVQTCRDKCVLELATEAKCDMIERDIHDRIKNGIFYLPTMVVNGEAIRGDISCSSPITTSTCNVLNYMCQGYLPSTRPAACTTPADGCNFYEKRDCAGVCGGSASVDRCGICLGPEDRSRDRTCRDCNNEIHGNYTLDACGICMAPNNSTRDTSCKDCKGVIHGKAKLDQCNVCEGDGKSCQEVVTQTSTSWGAIIVIVIAIAGVVGGVIYLYMRRQQNRMRDDIDGILKQYLPLDGSAGGGGGGGGTGHIRPTQRLDGHENL